jgi:hypothetical protein
MKTFVRKFDIVNCIQWTGMNAEEINLFCTNKEKELRCLFQNNELYVLHPIMKDMTSKVEIGQFLVKKGNQSFDILSEEEFTNLYQEFILPNSKPVNKKIKVEKNILKIGLALPIRYEANSDKSKYGLIIHDAMGVDYYFNRDGSYDGYSVAIKGILR